MNPVDLTGRTRAIGAPRTWDPAVDGECSVLPVRDGVEGAFSTMTSAWLSSDEDRRLIDLGLPLLLTIYGNVHPVVALGMGQPSDVPQIEETADV